MKFKKNVIYKLNIDFWSNKNYQLGIPDNKCFKDKKIAIIRNAVFLNPNDDDDKLSLKKYMSLKKLSLGKMVELVNNNISCLTFEDDDHTVAKKLNMVKSDDISANALKTLLLGKRNLLRGLEEGAIILCDKAQRAIRVSRCEGFVPSKRLYPSGSCSGHDISSDYFTNFSPSTRSFFADEEGPKNYDSAESLAYPTRFTIIKKLIPKKITAFIFVVEFETEKKKESGEQRGYGGVMFP
ncbi:MAG: hypothetical protein AAB781_01010 [Patescibacteria group bacterium]